MTQLMVCPKFRECDKKNKRFAYQNEDHNRCVPHEIKKKCEITCPFPNNITDEPCPPCEPFEFAAGDRVRVLGKTPCINKGGQENSFNLEWAKKERFKAETSIQSLHNVCEICLKQLYWLADCAGIYHAKDLEYIGEKDMIDEKTASLCEKNQTEGPKYKVVGHPSAANIYENGTGRCFLKHFASLLEELKPKHIGSILEKPKLLAWAEKNPVRIKWLLEKGYIDLVESAFDKWVDDCPFVSSTNRRSAIEWAKRYPGESA